MTLFEKFEQHKILYSYFAVFIYFFINNTINASSVWMEQTRDNTPAIAMWEPFVWEYTSAVCTLLLLPLVVAIFRRFPPKFDNLKRQFAIHFIVSGLFSLAHVLSMVLLREWIYLLNDGSYDFGPWLREFWYEYRKDVWGYLFFFFVFQMANFIYVRLKGEASIIADDEEGASVTELARAPEHFLVKKLDKEFLVKVADIEWLESAGNYVNLHSGGRIYPLRTTLAKLSERLSTAGFSRIHRSYAVNHNAIESISYQPSGDGDVLLNAGKMLNLSRRYKDGFKQALS